MVLYLPLPLPPFGPLPAPSHPWSLIVALIFLRDSPTPSQVQRWMLFRSDGKFISPSTSNPSAYRELGSKSTFMKFEYVLCTKKFALSASISLYSGEISDNTIPVKFNDQLFWHRISPRLYTGLVANSHLLLLVKLPGIDQFFNRACSQESINIDVAGLTETIGPVHSL